jgi:uncharacterized protein (DUF58 family)
MTLRARYVAEGFMSGLHHSSYTGSSLEFAQHRQYVPGDELKYIDWKIYGKTDRFYVKQFQEETNLRGYSIIDTSASMGYTSGEVTKLEYASYLSAAITYMMVKQSDSAGLITYNKHVGEFIPPRNFKSHFQHLMNKLDDLRPADSSDFGTALNEIGTKIKKRSMLILFSDLFAEIDVIIKSLKFFHYMKNDLIVFHILDPEEVNLNRNGLTEYIDMESGMKLRTQPEVIRKEYRKNFGSFLRNIEKNLQVHGIDYYRITTDMTLDQALSRFMEGRKREFR